LSQSCRPGHLLDRHVEPIVQARSPARSACGADTTEQVTCLIVVATNLIAQVTCLIVVGTNRIRQVRCSKTLSKLRERRRAAKSRCTSVFARRASACVLGTVAAHAVSRSLDCETRLVRQRHQHRHSSLLFRRPNPQQSTTESLFDPNFADRTPPE
jgi:hypothetical protein